MVVSILRCFNFPCSPVTFVIAVVSFLGAVTVPPWAAALLKLTVKYEMRYVDARNQNVLPWHPVLNKIVIATYLVSLLALLEIRPLRT